MKLVICCTRWLLDVHPAVLKSLVVDSDWFGEAKSVRDQASDLPSYKNPPITEVVVGVAFRDAPSLSAAHLGELWASRWEEDFPRVEEHPPYFPPIERFDAPILSPSIALQFGETAPTRLWFVTRDGQELIQAQRDWFACNWRKVRPGSEYDRWPARRTSFEQRFREFEGYIRERGLGKATLLQCELSYINHVPLRDGLAGYGDLPRVLRLTSPVDSDFLPTPEQIQIGATFTIRNEGEQPVGRLHVTAQPGTLREGGLRIFVLNLTARGAPEGDGLAGALRFLDRGRQWIVRAFTELTTQDMHATWERER